MDIFSLIKEGLRIARTSKTLWLYGFFVGIGAAGNTANHYHRHAGPEAAHIAPHALTGWTALLGIMVLAVIVAGVFMHFVSAGALIEGVMRVRRGAFQTVREGWHRGLAHWGVLFRIALIYLAISVASVVILAAPFLLAQRFSGTALAVTLAIPCVLIAAAWLVTLYMWQAFASRIAVLENRRARDAAAKARLFLHGRLLQGLKLIIAAILGRMIVMLLGSIGLVAAVLLVFVALKAIGMAHATIPVLALGAATLLPAAFILIAVSGTTQSSIWTIGYLTEREQ